MVSIRRKALQSWGIVAFLAALCVVLAVLQYQWIGEISSGEELRLRTSLRDSVNRLSRDCNGEIASIFRDLTPPVQQIETDGREQAYASHFIRWRETAHNAPLIAKIALGVPVNDKVELRIFREGRFQAAAWPDDWIDMQQHLQGRLNGQFRGSPLRNGLLIESPRFATPAENRSGRSREQEWLIIEWNAAYLHDTYFPQLVQRHLQGGPQHSYRVIVFSRARPTQVLYRSEPGLMAKPDGFVDAWVNLMEMQMRGGGPDGPAPTAGAERKRNSMSAGRGQWVLQVQYAAGSLESYISSVRWRNLGISAMVLLLMLATAILLVRSARQQEHLARMQLNFVAGVSHELRTPLTVIRTAAFNLRGKVANNPSQVERYGKLIQEESEKLGALVEQVLRFAGAESGMVIRQKEPIAVEHVLESAIDSARLPEAISVERSLEDHLPLVMGDELALRHAMQNLVDNAAKYAAVDAPWIGVSARRVDAPAGPAVEVRIADRGPGIPAAEQPTIFDPFVRGERAISDQIHGTGLGLHLVKRIVEAHGGTIRLESDPQHRTEFIVTIPAAPAEKQDEFANSTH